MSLGRKIVYFLVTVVLLQAAYLWMVTRDPGTVPSEPPAGLNPPPSGQPAQGPGPGFPAFRAAARGVAMRISDAGRNGGTPEQMTGLYREGLQALKPILAEHPGYLYARYLSGCLMMATGDESGAYAAFKQALTLPAEGDDPIPDPSVGLPATNIHMESLVFLSILEMNRGEEGPAREHLLKAIRMLPDLEKNKPYPLTFRDLMLSMVGRDELGASYPADVSVATDGEARTTALRHALKRLEQTSDVNGRKVILATLKSGLTSVRSPYTAWYPAWRPIAQGYLSLLEGDAAKKAGDAAGAEAAWKQAQADCPYMKGFVKKRRGH